MVGKVGILVSKGSEFQIPLPGHLFALPMQRPFGKQHECPGLVLKRRE